MGDAYGGRLYIRKGDGSGELDGSVVLDTVAASPITVNYVSTPNVQTPEYAPTSEDADFDLSDGFDSEDIRAIGETALDIGKKVALGAAGVGIVLAGTAAAAPSAAAAETTGITATYDNAAAREFSSRMVAQKTVVTTKAASAAKCAAAVKAVKAAQKSGANGKVVKAKKNLAKCRAAKATTTTPTPEAAKPTASTFDNLQGPALAKAIDQVSGANWADQSNLPLNERVGVPTNAPSGFADFLKENPGSARGVFTCLNSKPGDAVQQTIGGEVVTFTTTGPIVYVERGGGAMAKIPMTRSAAGSSRDGETICAVTASGKFYNTHSIGGSPLTLGPDGEVTR